MELNSESVHDVIHPTAAFSHSPPCVPAPEGGPAAWAGSQLNPKNRMDSLDPPEHPLWRIDGCTGLGTQFYAVPTFMGDVPPMRFDVFIPEEAGKNPLLRRLLDLNAAFHTKDTDRVRRLGVSSYILRRLQLWTTAAGLHKPDSVPELYRSLPFGSRIVFDNLDLNIHRTRISVAPTHYVEAQLVSLANLRTSLRFAEDFQLPPTVDIYDLSIVQQLHDSVCTVRFNAAGRRRFHDRSPGHVDATWIFKALTSDTKYLYSELRVLLRMPAHRNVMRRPEYLVTKKCRFGGKLAVVGFLLEFHASGGLRDQLPLLRINGRLARDDQLKWALQLTSALAHVRNAGGMFYPDLRLDNIVLSSHARDLVMVDFEQRGVWCEFAAPEINALDYMRILATDTTRSESDPTIPEDIRERFGAILTKLLPDWQAVQASEEYGTLPHHYDAYNIPWLCLSAAEQEAAEVYMLGRVLWCLFEGQCAPQHAAVWQSYRFEPDVEFPRFHKTPAALRDIVDRCTRGRRRTMSSMVVRRGSLLVLRSGAPGAQHNADEVLDVARDWWIEEIKASEAFLRERERLKAAGGWSGNYYNRPSVREVMKALQDYARSVGWEGPELAD